MLKILRILLHAAALTVTDLAAILFGFGAYSLLGSAHQLATQVPLAAVAAMGGMVAWFLLARKVRLAPSGSREYLWIYLAAFALLPTILVPLHYVTQGYWTKFANITWTWVFQAPVNALGILLARRALEDPGQPSGNLL